MRLLYVDDDRINTLLFVEACKCVEGLEVDTAGSGEEALAAVDDGTLPQVLVIDLHLPDTDGYALLGRLRERPQLESVPAFLCTAENLDEVAQASKQAGFAGCWGKPVDLRCILEDLAIMRDRPASADRD